MTAAPQSIQPISAALRQEIERVFSGWLDLYENGNPIIYTPAREYASDAVKDCRDAVLAALDRAALEPEKPL